MTAKKSSPVAAATVPAVYTTITALSVIDTRNGFMWAVTVASDDDSRTITVSSDELLSYARFQSHCLKGYAFYFRDTWVEGARKPSREWGDLIESLMRHAAQEAAK